MQPYIESESSYNRYRYHAIRIPPPIYRPVALAILLGLLLVGLFACSSFVVYCQRPFHRTTVHRVKDALYARSLGSRVGADRDPISPGRISPSRFSRQPPVSPQRG